MAKIITETKTQENIKKGIDKLVNIVKKTLGGKGKNVIISDEYDRVQIINDGVSIASEIELEDPIENVGAILAKQCAQKTNREAGDGTTTTLVLLQAYLEEMEKIETNDPRRLRDEIQKVLGFILKEINPRELKDDDIKKIAQNAALDEEIAQAVYDIIKKVRIDGLIDIEELDRHGIESEVVFGLKIEDGFMYQALGGEMTNCDVLVCKKKLEEEYDLVQFLEAYIKSGRRRLVVFCSDVKKNVAGFLAINRHEKVLDVVLVKTNDLDDVATITGAKIVSEESGLNLGVDVLGHCDKALIAQNYTLISGGNAEKEVIGVKVKELEEELKNVKLPNEKMHLEKRIARLKGGVSVIRIGGYNQQSMRERKLKLEDAINAVKAAMQEGIVEGGGMCLSRIAEKIELNGDAERLMINVIKSPYQQILINADEETKILTEKAYNVITRQYEDFFETGIIDPAKVVRCALINAIGTGNMILTADSSIVYKKDAETQTKEIR